jgi:hypothetical protein
MNTTKKSDSVNENFYTIGRKRYVRVSRLLEATGASDFSAIPSKDKDFYMARGTARHEMFEHIERGVDGQHTYDPRIEAYRAGHAKFLRETDAKAFKSGIEKRVYATWESIGFAQRHYPPFCEAGIAGRLDRFGTIQGRLALWDFKGHEVPKSTGVQTALYLMMMPEHSFAAVERYGVAILPDGTYRMSQKYPLSDFQDAQDLIHKYLKETK